MISLVLDVLGMSRSPYDKRVFDKCINILML